MRNARNLFAAAVALFGLGASEAAAAAVNVAPMRVVLDRGARSAAVTLYNDDPASEATYRIALVDRFMTAEGVLRPVTEGEPAPDGLRSARSMLRVSPTQIRLGPGEAQTIRILARPPEGAPEGEYRAHLSIMALPKVEAPSSVASGGGLNIKLSGVYSATIPIIVRIGDVSAAAVLRNAKFETSPSARGPVLAVDLARRGEASVVGDIAVVYVPPSGGKTQEVGRVRRVATYTEVPSRPVIITLKQPEGHFASGGRLVARMYADLDQRGVPLAEVEAVVP